MIFVADESLEARLVAIARNASHVVFSIHEETPGLSDTDVLALSVRMNAPVITNDKDFGELVFRQRLASVGVLLLRFPFTPTLAKAERLVRWLETPEAILAGNYVVLGVDGARIRRLP